MSHSPCEAGFDIPIVKRKKLNQRESQDFTCDHPTFSGWRQNTNLRRSDFDIRVCIPHPSNSKTLFLLERAVVKLLSRAWRTEDVSKVPTFLLVSPQPCLC